MVEAVLTLLLQGNVVPTYQTPDLQTCVDGCSNNTACQGVNYPVGGKHGSGSEIDSSDRVLIYLDETSANV